MLVLVCGMESLILSNRMATIESIGAATPRPCRSFLSHTRIRPSSVSSAIDGGCTLNFYIDANEIFCESVNPYWAWTLGLDFFPSPGGMATASVDVGNLNLLLYGVCHVNAAKVGRTAVVNGDKGGPSTPRK